MAGTNQHFIPQSLLRRFGHKKSGKATRVAVYEQGNVFVTATTGAAAQRYFYSKLSANGERTLDDKITDYESRLAALFVELDSAKSGSLVDAEGPSELIAHLCIRNAQVRESFGHMSGQLLGGVLDMFADPKKRWQLMGLDKSEPSTLLLEEFNKGYDAAGLALRGISRERFIELCFASAKIQFNPSAPNPLPEFDAFAAKAREMAPNLAKDGHGRALEKGLVPEARRGALRALTWRVHDTDFDLVLPDCIAIDWPKPGHCRAFVYCPNDELTHVVMPIASRRYLVGACDERTHDASAVNRSLVQCCWRFFIARDRAECFESLVPEIGTVTRAWADSEIEGALAKAQIT